MSVSILDTTLQDCLEIETEIPSTAGMMMEPILADNFRRVLQNSDGNFILFIIWPRSLSFLIVIVRRILGPVMRIVLQRRNAKRNAATLVEAAL